MSISSIPSRHLKIELLYYILIYNIMKYIYIFTIKIKMIYPCIFNCLIVYLSINSPVLTLSNISAIEMEYFLLHP